MLINLIIFVVLVCGTFGSSLKSEKIKINEPDCCEKGHRYTRDEFRICASNGVSYFNLSFYKCAKRCQGQKG